MNWLQARLKELNLTHKDLQKALAERGIERVRATITGWTGDKPISLLNDPQQTAILAEALGWTTTELLIAAGYHIAPTVPPALNDIFKQYQTLDPDQRALFHFAVQFGFEFSGNLNAKAMPPNIPGRPPPNEDEATS
ncbi:MAG: hypothetical protein AAFN11_01190 [Chloroflexota bacterium]